MKPVIEMPKGATFQDKNSKTSLAFDTRFQQKWQGQYTRAQMFMDSEVLRGCEPYIPLLTGTLIRTGVLGTDIGSGVVQWIAPYAKRQYFSPREPGSKTGPLRGPYWFERWKSVNGQKVVTQARRIAGGKQ